MKSRWSSSDNTELVRQGRAWRRVCLFTDQGMAKMTNQSAGQDKWSKWLLETRVHGSVPGRNGKEELDGLIRLRDKLLERAYVREGMTLLDVGAGDGLIAFGALEKLGPTGKVILSDISEPLLEHARGAAGQMDALGQSSFVKAGAEDLSAIPDESVDVVTTRSVLIYVDDKARALREFYRVLKPGGRIALFETVSGVLAKLYRPNQKWTGLGGAVFPCEALEAISDLVARYTEQLGRARQAAASLGQADHFDYLRLCEDTGFTAIEVELHLYSHKPKVKIERLLGQSLNPHFPTPAEHMEKIFSPEERQRFIDHMRPLFDQGVGTTRTAGVYVWAHKPPLPPESLKPAGKATPI